MDSNEEVLKRLKVAMARVTYVPPKEGPAPDMVKLVADLNGPNSPVVQQDPITWVPRDSTYPGHVKVSHGQVLLQGFMSFVAQQSVTDQKTLDKLDTIIRSSGFVVRP